MKIVSPNSNLIKTRSDKPVSRATDAQPSRWSGRMALLFAGIAALLTSFVIWQATMADVRAIRALPDSQRVPLFQRTLQNLTTVCDPAATRSLSAFCHEQAALALKFRECDIDPHCQELARRHLPTPRR